MNKTFFGDCRESMRLLVALDIKVQTCITSPPYYGLRDYGHPGQLGLEKTPDQYVAAMVKMFRLVRELLADDGTLWLNLGDSYGRNPAKGQHKPGDSGKQAYIYDQGNGRASATFLGSGIKEKDLMGIPWRVAFALQADGWYLRQDIIWHKPNPMPESVTDRCTKAHEYLFLLSKASRYYFDAEAIKEPLARPNEGNRKTPAKFGGANKHVEAGKYSRLHSGNDYLGTSDGKRNRRSVWTISTKPYKGTHFATFPPELVEPCILAGSRPGDTVLDPFMGSGTTGMVAQKHNRQWIGCELQPEYKILQDERLT